MTGIIVGVDGSPHSAAALRWAHREARLRADRLVALLAWGYVPPGHPGGGHTFDAGLGSVHAEALLTATIADTLGPEAAGTIERRVVYGMPAEELRDAAADADLLVVGSRGVGGLHSALIGSVSRQLLRHPVGPLAVVPPPGTSGRAPGEVGRIVVGFEESPSAARALAWAADEARLRHARIDVVRAWHARYPVGAAVVGCPVDYDVGEEEDARTGLDLAVTGIDRAGLPGPPAGHLVSGPAGPAILDAAAGADLVVLGTHGHGAVAAALLGSVTHHVAAHAPVPVVIVP